MYLRVARGCEVPDLPLVGKEEQNRTEVIRHWLCVAESTRPAPYPQPRNLTGLEGASHYTPGSANARARGSVQIPVKIPMPFFTELEKEVPEIMWKHKELQIV